MFVVTILAVLLLAQIIAYKVDRKLADALPMTVCGFVLILYVLSVFRVMSWIDYLAIPVILLEIIWIISNGLYKEIIGGLFSIQNICIYICMWLITLTQYNRVVTSWDDMNYWATDLKALWYNDGLAMRYADVCPEYGSYPPALQLFRWFFVHMGGADYHEGLGYSGYQTFNFILLLPLIGRLDSIVDTKESILSKSDEELEIKVAPNKKYRFSNKKLVSKYKVNIGGNNSEVIGERIIPSGCAILAGANIGACLCLILFPYIIGGTILEYTCIDTTVGLLYGILLWSIYDRDEDYDKFYYGRIVLLGSLLILSRSCAVLLIFLAILFFVLIFRNAHKGAKYNKSLVFESDIRKAINAVVAVGGVGSSWLIICLFKQRTFVWADSLYKIITSRDKYLFYYASVKKVPLLKGLLYPLYSGDGWSVDIPLVLVIVLIFAAVFVMRKKEVVNLNIGNLLMEFMSISLVIIYLGIFLSQITVFIGDVRYLDDSFVIESVARFGSIWILGTIVLLMLVFIKSRITDGDYMAVTDAVVKDQMVVNRYKIIRVTYLIVAIVILVLSDPLTYCKGVIGYRSELDDNLEARTEMLDESETQFVELVKNTIELIGNRVLYIKAASDFRGNHNAYINYAVAPVSVTYGIVSYDGVEETLSNIIADSHAGFVYFENIEDLDDIIAPIVEWQYESEEEMVHLYRVLPSGNIEPYRETVQMD